jgi:hypothetical protein
VSATRKPQAALRVVGSAPGISRTTPDPHRTLVSLLEMAFGGVQAANAAIAQALALTGRHELPPTGPALLAFVRAHLLAPLSEEIGPRLTMALVDDLVALLDPATVPVPPRSSSEASSGGGTLPKSSPRVRGLRLAVLLVDADRLGRTTLARALLRAEWNVTLVDTVPDLLLALEDDAAIHAVMLDVAHPAAQAIVTELVRSRPEVAVVARTGDVARTRALLGALVPDKLTVCSRHAVADELIDALKRSAEG